MRVFVTSACCLLLCSGAGWAEQQQLSAQVDVSVGTFSKAFGCHGGFVAGSAALITFLTNRGRPYVFSTALPAPVAAAALAALRASQQVSAVSHRSQAAARAALRSGSQHPADHSPLRVVWRAHRDHVDGREAVHCEPSHLLYCVALGSSVTPDGSVRGASPVAGDVAPHPPPTAVAAPRLRAGRRGPESHSPAGRGLRGGGGGRQRPPAGPRAPRARHPPADRARWHLAVSGAICLAVSIAWHSCSAVEETRSSAPQQQTWRCMCAAYYARS